MTRSRQKHNFRSWFNSRQREIKAEKWGHTDMARSIVCAATWERGGDRQRPRSRIIEPGQLPHGSFRPGEKGGSFKIRRIRNRSNHQKNDQILTKKHYPNQKIMRKINKKRKKKETFQNAFLLFPCFILFCLYLTPPFT